jgi:multidrug efflux pump subunit AcrA (membrane-fusion protein)
VTMGPTNGRPNAAGAPPLAEITAEISAITAEGDSGRRGSDPIAVSAPAHRQAVVDDNLSRRTDSRRTTEETPTNGVHAITEAPRAKAVDPPRTRPADPPRARTAYPASPPGSFATLFAPRPTRPKHRARTIASILLALAFLGALAYVVKSAFLSGIAAFPAVVEPAQTTELDFQNMGAITAIDVYPGESVKAGQVIATQSTQLEQLRLSYDQSVLVIDKQSFALLQAYLASQATASQLTNKSQISQRNLQVQLAQEQEAAAQALLHAATTPQQVIQAQAAISEAQTRLALAEAAQIATSPTTASPALTSAQAAIARDQSQIAGDQLLIQEGAITAPEAGVIAAVTGSVGELAGPDGVISPASSGASVPVAPSFQLFPPAAQAPGTKSSSVFSPLVILYGGNSWDIVAQVPQAQIEALRVGQSASVSIAGDSRTFQARVVRIALTPVVANGTVSYDVLFGLTGSTSSLAAGMAANVVMGSAHH